MRWPPDAQDEEVNVTDHAVWPLLPLQAQLAPWVMLFIGLALVIAFVILMVDSIERQRD